MHLVADEEALGTHGTKFLVANGYCDGVTEAIVGEPTDMHLVPAERGAVWLRVITEGVSAHGSTPQLGVNAIQHMARVIDEFSQIRFRKLHEMLGAPTFNIGTITRRLEGEHGAEALRDRDRPPDDPRRERRGRDRPTSKRRSPASARSVPDLKARVEVIDWAEAVGDTGREPGRAAAHGSARSVRDRGVGDRLRGSDRRALPHQPGRRSRPSSSGRASSCSAHTTGESVDVAQVVEVAKIYAYTFARVPRRRLRRFGCGSCSSSSS